jgi:hypothetical protein
MFRISLPFTDWTVELSPRWGNLDSAWQIALLALLALIPVALVLWLYRYELRLVRRPTALLLLGLRLVVIVLLWCVVAMQPVLALSTTEEIPGRVLVALDQSASMNVPDPQRTKLEKLRLARALRIRAEGGLPTAEQLDAWIAHYQAKGGAGEPPWVTPDEARDDDTRRQQLADERRAAHDKVCAAVDQLTRAEVARRLLASDGAGLLARLAAKHKVQLAGFDRDVWEIKAEQLDKLLRGKARAPERPGAGFTDLRGPLLHALERSGPDQGRTLGLLLLTDGQHNWGPSPVKKAGELGKLGVPVFPVALGARKAPPDIALLEVKAPANVFKDVDAAVDARIKVSGLPAQELIVELSKGKGPPAEEHIRRIRHDGSDRLYTVPFQVRMDEVGTQALEVKVRPTLEGTKEINEDNNRRTAVVRVASDRAKVLAIDGEARWEFHYLINALRRDRSMEPEAVVFVQPRVGRIPEAQLEKQGNPRLSLPRREDAKEALDPLLKYDCIILGDVSPDQLPIEDRKRLEKYVADRGGTLVLLAGKRYLPLAFHPEGSAGEDDPLLKMLPVERARAVSPLKGFAVAMTHEGKLTSFLQMDSTPEASAQRWAEFPRHYWGLVGRPKPGAVALAYVAEDFRRPEDLEREKKDKDNLEKAQALVVRQNYGFGRVLLVGLDSTWRWRFKAGDVYHHRFWGQLVRWAASDKLLPAGNRYVRFGSRDPVYRQGKEVAVVVRLEDEVPPLPPGSVAAARIFRRTADGKEEPAALVELARGERQPRLLEAEVRDLPPGQYRIELHIPELAEKLKEPPEGGEPKDAGQRRDVFTVLPADGGETVELATNWTLLESVAAAGKGQVFTPEDAGRLVELLTKRVETREHRDEEKLWQDASDLKRGRDQPLVWVMLGVFLLLLTVEWVGRKLAGLP